MRKILYAICLSLSFVASLTADITSNLTNFENLQCTFEPAISRNARWKGENEEHGNTGPHLPISDGTSLNWCGYASATNLGNPSPGSVANVSGAWTVPNLTPTDNTTYCSLWVGIDGYGSGSVEQIGTEHDWSKGSQYNYAWYEMYPYPSYEIVGFPLEAGDLIQGEVEYKGENQFRLSLVNHTKSVYAIIPGKYTSSSSASRSSAEWVVEAPSTIFGVLPLADFQSGAFTNCTATINNITGGINNPNWQTDSLTMITDGGIVRAAASDLAEDGESFNMTWEHE